MFPVASALLEAAKVAVRPMMVSSDLSEKLVRFEPYRWQEPLPELPVLSLDDVSAIPFLVGITGIEEYQHRARLRAGDGDLFAAGTPQTAGYEEYCRDFLGLGAAAFIHAEPEEGPLAVASACSHGASLKRIVEAADAAGGLVIHPYMGIEPVWQLAQRITEESGQPTVGSPTTRPHSVKWSPGFLASNGWSRRMRRTSRWISPSTWWILSVVTHEWL
jgi:hypothetical protein